MQGNTNIGGARRTPEYANTNMLGDELVSFSEEVQRRPEVRILNKYVVVMAFIRTGLKGVGALVLLWATVVLLGGFVSDLSGDDFWDVTIIAFVQAAGLSEAMGDARFEFFGDWLGSLRHNIPSCGEKRHHERTQLAMTKWHLARHIRILVLKIIDIILMMIFLPVVYFSFLGPVSGSFLSISRLSMQDYGIADGDASKANMKPALNLFYSVSLAHGGINLLYLIMHRAVATTLVVIVSQQHGFSPELLDGYLQETRKMCVNNPASTVSWNLITYGAGLLDSHLPEDYVSGGRVLTMLIDKDISVPITRLLIMSPRQRIQKLIGSLAWRNPAEREMRWCAAKIVEHLACHLNLAQCPGALECISSLLDSSCQYTGDQEALHLPFAIGRSKQWERTNILDQLLAHHLQVLKIFLWVIYKGWLEPWVELIGKIYGATENYGTLEKDSKHNENFGQIDEDLVLPGLRILGNLAHDKHNCTLICNTKDLLSKVVAPVCSNKFVEDVKRNSAWTKVVDGSLKVVSRLMGSPGSTGEEMRSLIGDDSNAINNLEGVLDMDMKNNCSIIELHVRAIEVLTQLVLHRPASSATASREKLIKSVLHFFITKDWMVDYLKDEKRKIDELTTIQQNTLSRPSMRTRVNNLVKEFNGAREKERMAQRAAEARAVKKMKEAKERARRLKEKAGEALAMLSGDSEVIKSFTGHEDVVLHLTELLDPKIKTIQCEIGPADTVEIEIQTGCRISAAVILKNLSNYVKESTLHKVLEVLLPIQAEASSTIRCWERVTGCIRAIRNDIENPSGGGQVEPSALRRQSHIQQCVERRLQAELLSLVAAIRASGNVNFAAALISLPQQDAQLETFVVRLKKMVEDNMYATPACLAIQKLTCEMVIEFIPHDRNAEVIEKHNIVGTLLKASKRMAGLESSMLFAGVDRDCHGVALRPLSSDLAKQAEELLTQRKQVLGISTTAPAGVP